MLGDEIEKKKREKEICRVNRKGMAITLVGAKEECLQEFFLFFFFCFTLNASRAFDL